jgi:hypothetical protein
MCVNERKDLKLIPVKGDTVDLVTHTEICVN